ncbi:hypothetical protein [Paenibacillus ihumii]|uniref:hypothetical protein n=1 Tax=Paenibacillus ihumii TaxID=687436 RepID=UPI0006D85C9B|nr:hypothetical protein [Paenibacillus ihumii]
MEHWIFTGTADKRDLLLYICKVLASAGRRVLLVDATSKGKYGYVIEGISTGEGMIEFHGFDVALASAGSDKLERCDGYDYCLYDVDYAFSAGRKLWSEAGQIIWVTSYDRFEIADSCGFFSRLFQTWPELRGIKVQPVFTRTMDTLIDEQYVLSFMEQLPIEWQAADIRIPWDEINFVVQMENEYSQTLRMKAITRAYKRAITELISRLAGWESKKVKRAFRKAERRKA